MSLWNATIDFFWRAESAAMLAMVLALAGSLFYFRKEDRASLINALGVFFVCFFGQFASSLIRTLEFTNAAEVLREVFVIGAGIVLIRLWGELIFRIVLPLGKMTLPRIAEDIFVIIAYIGWGMVRLRYAGLDLGSIVATSAMMTAVVAFSMQDTLGNILGGLALQLDNSIGIGDWIKVDDLCGKVVDIRWRSTLVETRNGETVVFPNSQLMKNKFLVLGRRSDMPAKWRRWVWFNVDMEISPAKVIAVVEESIQQTDIRNVAKNPLPNCVLMEMDDKGYLRYALRYWLTDMAADDPTDAMVRWHVMTALQRAGIKLAMDKRSLHIVRENEKYEEGVHQREVLLRVKTLKRVDLFSQMTDAELLKLAKRLKYTPFAGGAIISRQGATAHWLYIIIRGEAEVYLETPGGGRRTVRHLSKGNFFGEMGMMTGAPRAATVVAKTDVECYRLDKEMFEEILRARPSIAEEMSHILAIRRAELESAMQYADADAESSQKEISQKRNEILSTIKHFFGMDS